MINIIVNYFINKYFRRQKPEDVLEYLDRFAVRLSETGRPGILDRYFEAEESFAALPHEDVSVISADGLTLRGRFYGSSGGGHGYVLLAHGFRSSGERDFGLQFGFLRRCGLNILVIDQRAHGHSEGEYVALGSLEMKDVKLWTDYIKSRDAEACIVLYGVSMGATACCGAAGLLGDDPAFRGLIADCGFVSPHSLLRGFAGGEKKPFINRFMKTVDRVFLRKTGGDTHTPDLLSVMKEVKAPALFVHGGSDSFVPPDNTRRLFEACGSAYKRLLTVENAGHAEAFVRGEEEYRKEIEGLLKVCFPET